MTDRPAKDAEAAPLPIPERRVPLGAEEVIRRLGLAPHPREGGYFVETYRSTERHGERSLSTAIYYLLTARTFSEMHRLTGDEVFHFYAGDPAEMLLLAPGGAGEKVTLGADLLAGERPQVVVPGGVWQGTRLLPGGRFALLGTTMAPGFDPSDYETGDRDALEREFPAFSAAIRARTR